MEEILKTHLAGLINSSPEPTASMRLLIQDLQQYKATHPDLVASIEANAKQNKYSDFHANAFPAPQLTLMQHARTLPAILAGVQDGRYDG